MEPRGSSAAETPAPIPGGQIILLAVWLGAAALFAAVVAPAAFAVLPSRELAGAVVGRVLPTLFWWGIATGAAFVALDLLDAPLRFRMPRLGLGALIVVGCAIAQLAIAPRIATLRAALTVPLATLAATDPQRVAFGRLHMMSVAWLGLAMLAAVVALTLAVLTLRSRGRP